MSNDRQLGYSILAVTYFYYFFRCDLAFRVNWKLKIVIEDGESPVSEEPAPLTDFELLEGDTDNVFPNITTPPLTVSMLILPIFVSLATFTRSFLDGNYGNPLRNKSSIAFSATYSIVCSIDSFEWMFVHVFFKQMYQYVSIAFSSTMFKDRQPAYNILADCIM
ncbi:hypothetical protein [Paenibacillus alkalitolerans]